jgi:sugar transferase (PEP-CTERM system associated)
MVRLFHVYYPVRRLLLLGCEATIICSAFLLAVLLRFGSDADLLLNYENGFAKILAVTGFAVLISYYFDLYGPQRLGSSGETYFRLLMVLGLVSMFIAAVSIFYPPFVIGNDVFLIGVVILTFALILWRAGYNWIIQLPFLRERIYVIGWGQRANTLVHAIRTRTDLGMHVVGWAGATANGSLDRETLAQQLRSIGGRSHIDRIIMAVSDRRGTMPVRELLALRLAGVKIEEAGTLLEKVQGKIEVDDLHPSSLIFAEGFRRNAAFLLIRRILSFSVAALALVICLPLIPVIALAVRFSSPGPVFFRQERVGHKGEVFTVYKFRTMRQDAEALTGAVWAGKHDPRITRVGGFLRKTRLDEIPQLWNVLRGDMGFVGPRPERPEFVQWLSEKIPYYELRHIIRPGVTGWAQVRYQYGASLEETREKLQYDLYYIKHMSLALDLLIMFETIKIILLRRGAQ